MSSIGEGGSGDVGPQSANLVQNHMFPIRPDAKTCTRCLSLFDSYLSGNYSGEKDLSEWSEREIDAEGEETKNQASCMALEAENPLLSQTDPSRAP